MRAHTDDGSELPDAQVFGQVVTDIAIKQKICQGMPLPYHTAARCSSGR
jgi:hypothetical protein